MTTDRQLHDLLCTAATGTAVINTRQDGRRQRSGRRYAR
jgi:hypothetical protein